MRRRGSDVAAVDSTFSPVLSFILHHAKGDERPYLRVSVLGVSLLGLLDSGASRTFLGSKGWILIKDLRLPLYGGNSSVTAANSESVGSACLPFTVESKLVMVDVVVVPELPHFLILGIDFWRRVGIIPDFLFCGI